MAGMVENHSLAFRAAQTHVEFYANESDLMTQHGEVMDCRDCEDFLRLGIDAFHWISRADEALRSAEYDGGSDEAARLDLALDGLYKGWQRPCECARKWIQLQVAKGHSPGNLREFQECCEEVEDRVQRRDWEHRSRRARTENFSGEEW